MSKEKKKLLYIFPTENEVAEKENLEVAIYLYLVQLLILCRRLLQLLYKQSLHPPRPESLQKWDQNNYPVLEWQPENNI
jgi:hypothetical protein